MVPSPAQPARSLFYVRRAALALLCSRAAAAAAHGNGAFSLVVCSLPLAYPVGTGEWDGTILHVYVRRG
jgi:hypothetical protein